jgi:DNA-binding helix-hairpin-helix protein with protein kinase domain
MLGWIGSVVAKWLAAVLKDWRRDQALEQKGMAEQALESIKEAEADEEKARAASRAVHDRDARGELRDPNSKYTRED